MFIETINWHSLFNKLNAANSSIYIVLPSIDEELAELLLSIKKEKAIPINVCIDNSEETIRNGYGDAKGVEKLIQNNLTVKESNGNRISFIIVDTNGFILFRESRIFTADPVGPNAMELDAFNCTCLIAHYFPPENIIEKEKLQERFDKSFEQQSNWIDKLTSEIVAETLQVSKVIDKQKFGEIQKALNQNPPIEPDLQRRIKTYNAKVQFVELKFLGINLQSRTINIPKDAVPINNKELMKLLQTKMKLFQDIEGNKDFAIFGELKGKVEILRDDYLKPITCREGKSLIQSDLKEAFKSRLQKIKNEIKEINKQLPDILEKATLKTKDLIKAELLKFFKANMPEELNQYRDPELKNRKLEEYVDRLVFKIPFPKTEKLIEKISLKDYYYDLTFQDFSDDKLIDELKKKEIMKDEDIKGIVEMKNAFEEKK